MHVREMLDTFKGRIAATDKKRKRLVATGIIGVLLLGFAGSMAYFTDFGTMTNDFTTGSLDLEETETEWGPDDEGDGWNVYPGYTVLKNPTVQNRTGLPDNHAWIKATITVTNHDGTPITDQERLDLIYYTIRYAPDMTHPDDPSQTMNPSKETPKGSDRNDIGKIADGVGTEYKTKYTKAEIEKFPNFNPAFKMMEENPLSGEQESDWRNGKRVYYLKDYLRSGNTPDEGESVTLFTHIVYPVEWTQDQFDIMGDYRITIDFEGIQRATFENVDEAMVALNKEIKDGTAHQNYERPVPANKNVDENGSQKDYRDTEEWKNSEDSKRTEQGKKPADTEPAEDQNSGSGEQNTGTDGTQTAE